MFKFIPYSCENLKIFCGNLNHNVYNTSQPYSSPVCLNVTNTTKFDFGLKVFLLFLHFHKLISLNFPFLQKSFSLFCCEGFYISIWDLKESYFSISNVVFWWQEWNFLCLFSVIFSNSHLFLFTSSFVVDLRRSLKSIEYVLLSHLKYLYLKTVQNVNLSQVIYLNHGLGFNIEIIKRHRIDNRKGARLMILWWLSKCISFLWTVGIIGFQSNWNEICFCLIERSNWRKTLHIMFLCERNLQYVSCIRFMDYHRKDPIWNWPQCITSMSLKKKIWIWKLEFMEMKASV